MAEYRKSSSNKNTTANKPVSTARKPSGSSSAPKKTSGSSAKKPSATNGKTSTTRSSSAPKKTVTPEKFPEKKKRTPKAPEEVPEKREVTPERRSARREIGAIVVFVLAMLAFICYFDVEALLINPMRDLGKGLFGWGFYALFPAFVLAGIVLLFHEDRPVCGKLVSALLLPLLFGALIHLFFYQGNFFTGKFSELIKDAWIDGKQGVNYCGGVLSGLLGDGLESTVSVFGAALILLVSFAVCLWQSTERIFKKIQENRQFVSGGIGKDYYTDIEDDYYEPMDFFDPAEMKESTFRQGTSRKKYDYTSQDFDFSDVPDYPVKPGPKTGKENTEKTSGHRNKESKKNEKFTDILEEEDDLFTAMPKRKKKTAPVMDTSDVDPLDIREAAAMAGVVLEEETASDSTEDMPAEKAQKIKIDTELEAALVGAEIAEGEEKEKPEYQFPPINLLVTAKSTSSESREEADECQNRLEEALQSYGVDARVVGHITGPTVTRYDLQLHSGVKLNKVTNLSNDIALSLGVTSVRIAPIPGQISTVGIEVPNKKINTVYLRDVIGSDNFKNASNKLSFAVGKDIGGNAVIGNISKMPHLLIAGTTGSGKSVCINSLILSLLYKSTPDEVRMIMIDPKMVELGIYNGMPHLFVPVVTDPKKAAGALQWSVVEMLKRYRMFSEVGVRDLAGYNEHQRKNGLATLPQVVIIVDELADLMMVASKEVEESICRVAQMGRAAGMHLVIATQRPSADVITGLMKANIPSRIAFAVSSALESRIILDQSGAEKLLGMGDMLYAPLGSGKPTRIQGAFVTDEEREHVINFVKSVSEAEYDDEILHEIEKNATAKDEKNSKNDSGDAEESSDDYDELFPQAVEVVLELKQASVSSLQRKLKLGYSRAARIVDQMEEKGIVGPYEGSKPRKVLITKAQWQEMQYVQGTAPVDSIVREINSLEDDTQFAELPQETGEYNTEDSEEI